MPSGTGMKHLEKAMPDRYIDVGTSLRNTPGFLPPAWRRWVSIRSGDDSTFLQRAYDCIHHDVCLQTCP